MNYYEILNISKNSSQIEIKKAYKNLALKYHPDKNNSLEAKEQFQKISEAYQTLSNKESRVAYDLDGTIPDIFDNPSEIFEKIFKNMDPVLSRFLTDTLSNFTSSLMNENKSVEQAFNEINTNDIIDKGSDVFKHYLKKNVNKNNVNKGILYYNLDINLEDIINNNENQIDVNIEFLRKYSNLRIIINDNNFKKTYEFDLKQDKFYLVFQNNTYLFELNYNFPDNIKRKYQSEHLFLEYYVNYKSYLTGFNFQYQLTQKINLDYNIFLKNSNIICFKKYGLYNYQNNDYGNLYVTFIPIENNHIQPIIKTSVDNLYSLITINNI